MSNSKLWKKVLDKKTKEDNGWYILRQEMEDFLVNAMNLTPEEVNEIYRVEFALKKELGLIKSKQEDEV